MIKYGSVNAAKEKGQLRRRITLATSVYCDEDAFVPGEYLVHLPFPALSAQQSEMTLLEGDPDGIGPEDAPARTAWWRRKLTQWQKFSMKYSTSAASAMRIR